MKALHPYDWVAFLADDYSDYIAHGGAAIRLSVPEDDETADALIAALRSSARNEGHLYVAVDGARHRLHMPQDIMEGLARQVDWIAAAGGYLRTRLIKEGLEPPSGGLDDFLQRTAELNNLERADVSDRLVRAITENVENLGLTRDFRFAINRLCGTVLLQSAQNEDYQATILDWLTVGRRRLLRDYYSVGIFHRINRTNARSALRSALAWLAQIGTSGTTVVIDARRLAYPYRIDKGLAYPRGQLLDAYEVMREFIDDAHAFRGTMIVWVMDPEFLDLEPSGRGVGSYPALRYRVYDEVRDRRVANPLATMARLSLSSSKPQHAER